MWILNCSSVSKTPRWNFHARIQPKAIFYMQWGEGKGMPEGQTLSVIIKTIF